jgi:hypothetical protein
MKRIIVVGHPNSSFQDIHQLLLRSGVAEACPSCHNNYTPNQISEILLKAHAALPVLEIHSDEPIRQIDVSPVWHGLHTDLFLANVEKNLWGWADTQAIYLLDYLVSIDSSIFFVLAYDKPSSVYTNTSLECVSATDGELEGWLKGWVAYNSALLKFHLRHPKRSILVHGDQAKISPQHWLLQIPGVLDTSTHEMPTLEKTSRGEISPSHRAGSLAIREAAPANHAERDRQTILGDPTLLELIVGDIVKAFPCAAQLFEELQATASSPSESCLNFGLSWDGAGLPVRYRAWRTLVAQKAALQDYVTQLASRNSDILALRGEIENQNAVIEALRSDQSTLTNIVTKEQAARTKLEKENVEKSEELQSLHKEKEHLLEENKITLGGEIERKNIAIEELRGAQSQLSALVQKERAERVKLEGENNEKLKQLQNLKKEKDQLREENQFILTQLHHAQEELERHQLASHSPKKDNASSSPPLYGAANRIKQGLSYRLGARMIEHPKHLSGNLTLPVALFQELRRFRRSFPADKLARLPPIEAYADAKDADRIKRHLSYRLGEIFLAHTKNPIKWASLPWALRREVKKFEEEKRSTPTSTERQ